MMVKMLGSMNGLRYLSLLKTVAFLNLCVQLVVKCARVASLSLHHPIDMYYILLYAKFEKRLFIWVSRKKTILYKKVRWKSTFLEKKKSKNFQPPPLTGISVSFVSLSPFFAPSSLLHYFYLFDSMAQPLILLWQQLRWTKGDALFLMLLFTFSLTLTNVYLLHFFF
jgi:hypothetical protein